MLCTIRAIFLTRSHSEKMRLTPEILFSWFSRLSYQFFSCQHNCFLVKMLGWTRLFGCNLSVAVFMVEVDWWICFSTNLYAFWGKVVCLKVLFLLFCLFYPFGRVFSGICIKFLMSACVYMKVGWGNRAVFPSTASQMSSWTSFSYSYTSVG